MLMSLDVEANPFEQVVYIHSTAALCYLTLHVFLGLALTKANSQFLPRNNE